MPKMVLYSGATSTACGAGNASAGPFYCSADQKLYIDLSFYNTMKNELRAAGDAAFAYVLAHEVGHHANGVGDDSKSQSGAATSEPEAGECVVGETGIAGGLLCGRVGLSCVERRFV